MTPERNRATAIGNMHKRFGKYCACGSGDILADRQTDTHTQTYSSQYFATSAAGEVNVIALKYHCELCWCSFVAGLRRDEEDDIWEHSRELQ